jgi:lipopolysaccharide transport system permease protein
LNPMSGIITSVRSLMIDGELIEWQGLVIAILVSLLIFVFGLFYYRKTERFFADIL